MASTARASAGRTTGAAADPPGLELNPTHPLEVGVHRAHGKRPEDSALADRLARTL